MHLASISLDPGTTILAISVRLDVVDDCESDAPEDDSQPLKIEPWLECGMGLSRSKRQEVPLRRRDTSFSILPRSEWGPRNYI